MAGEGMKAQSQDKAQDEVNEGFDPEEIVDGVVKTELEDEVHQLEVGHRLEEDCGRGRRGYLGVDHEGPDAVEQRLEKHPDDFPEGVTEDAGLPLGRDVGVNSLLS